ncbi:hypothetical protein C8R44DRAFT_892053 [Mycena epipterygia]|nr:hypothetical protein C8R44DRAFT_892053 [Mycena epipterygia]
MSATKQPMLSTTHAVFLWLQLHLKNTNAVLPEDADPALWQGLVDAHLKLSDYYTKFDRSRYYSRATLLDPRLSYEGLQKDYTDEPDLLEDLTTSKADLQLHYNLYYATSDNSSPSAMPKESLPPVSPMKFDIFARYGSQTWADATLNELEEYFRLTNIPEPFEGTDPLRWCWLTTCYVFQDLLLLLSTFFQADVIPLAFVMPA